MLKFYDRIPHPPPIIPHSVQDFPGYFFISFLFFFREKNVFFFLCSKGKRGYRTNPFFTPSQMLRVGGEKEMLCEMVNFFLKKGIKTLKK